MKHCLFKLCSRLVVLCFALVTFNAVQAADFHVGPSQALKTLAEVNWSALEGGDTVYIHYGTYPEKFNISSRGTEANPIRVIGVPDSSGNLPIIEGSGATTPASSDFRWQDPTLIQHLGVVFITPAPGDGVPLPGYIEIKNLEIRNGYVDSSFVSENGQTLAYNGFAAGVYIRSGQNILIENCEIHGNGQGVYVWTGSGNDWWDGLARDITLRGNYFYNNGHVSSYTEHQVYIEALNTVYEYNHFGAQRPGAYGSTIKDRGAGTVIRYNYFDSAPSGWWIDLPEPENGWMALGFSNDAYSQAFIYGNVFYNDGNYTPNYFHWNEDHQATGNNGTPGPNGRAVLENGRLYFYHNTVVTVGDAADFGYWRSFKLFNTTWGGYECATEGTRPGVIDVRNNIFAAIPRTPGAEAPSQHFAYCNDQNFNFANNLVTEGWALNTEGNVTGAENLISVSSSSDYGFLNAATMDFRLDDSSPAIGQGSALPSVMTSNFVGIDTSPLYQYQQHRDVTSRTSYGAGSDLGAYDFEGAGGGQAAKSFALPPSSFGSQIR